MTSFIKNAFRSHIHQDDPSLDKLRKDRTAAIRAPYINSNNLNNVKSSEYIKSSTRAPQNSVGWNFDCLRHSGNPPQRVSQLGNRIRSKTSHADH